VCRVSEGLVYSTVWCRVYILKCVGCVGYHKVLCVWVRVGYQQVSCVGYEKVLCIGYQKVSCAGYKKVVCIGYQKVSCVGYERV